MTEKRHTVVGILGEHPGELVKKINRTLGEVLPDLGARLSKDIDFGDPGSLDETETLSKCIEIANEHLAHPSYGDTQGRKLIWHPEDLDTLILVPEDWEAD